MFDSRRILGISPGILFVFLLCAGAVRADWPLAVELYAEGDWSNCFRECRRILKDRPDWKPAKALAGVCQMSIQNRLETGAESWDPGSSFEDADLRAMVFYQMGLIFQEQGRLHQAVRNLEQSFLQAKDPVLSARAGCTLYQILRETPDIVLDGATRIQLETLAPTWDRKIRRETALASRRGCAFSKPGEWIVAFYRRQIGPAIGMRCSLAPD